MFILLIMVYQILNALKSVSQVYYAGWVVHGNSYGDYAAIQAKFTMVAMAPMGPMLFVVVPMIKKFGRRKMIILGGIMAFVGSTAAFFSAGDSTLIVYLGTAFSGIGGMFYVYTMMSYLGDVIDHVEYNKGIRCEGMTAALVGFVHSLSNGVGLGLFNLGLMLFKYRTPEKIVYCSCSSLTSTRLCPRLRENSKTARKRNARHRALITFLPKSCSAWSS